MMAGHGGDSPAVGGPARHIPVLLAEVVHALGPVEGSVFIDGTFGAGGYTRALLEAGARHVHAIDRDPQAIAAGDALRAEFSGRLTLLHAPFSSLGEVAAEVDGVVLDIGVSSMQIDEAERGFSFSADGPLDMRMAQHGPTAAEIVNRYKASDLTRIFGLLGEERHAGRIARMIEKRRVQRPFLRTIDLAQSIAALVGQSPRDRIHPATRVFQALRIHVNDELGELARALHAAERILKPGGRLVVVTFHSLEDRMVKRFIADRATNPAGSRHLPEAGIVPPTFTRAGGPVSAGDEEIARNPRSRSAKLRLAVRTAAPARRPDFDLFGLPALPALPQTAER